MRQTECVSFVSSPELDSIRPVLADAVDLARQALLDLGEGGIGEYLGVTAEDASAATHRFASDLEGYRGWQWAVVVAAPEDADHATVSELVLLPGPDALVAPTWVPWDERIRPGDLGPGDLLSPRQDDPRLVPGYVESGDPAIDEVAGEIGLGRSKVISLEGRLDAAQRWHDGDFGPDTEMAKAAPSTCGLCGFYLPIAGSMSAAFGVCGNEFAADGHVVHAEYGCGAHSDTELPTGAGSPQFEPYDDAALDVIASPVAPVEPAAVAETTDGVETADTDEAAPEASVTPQETASEEPADEVVAVDEAEPVADDASSTTDRAAQEEASASPS
ncbi:MULTISPECIES: DUF3027 domain-containing protein [Rhodococcus]|uniref:DUF3027 domain-containing protein n=2 Tax=Rhodococcus TaxID=1827 RepID=A0ABU4AXE0_9NOCA|nr:MULTISPECIES: DUF3027 domain-containing protein [Rhodococcus]MDV6230909.1 DUF3027 domain-containing protein [Rhodococcus cercidiphylli]MDV6302001.1 DUF3027 domain-containing protein [Rhodococcus cerastii]MDV8057527.1 DUF3027 domain-containing protein [Rhodococcus sp. IEGM 1343]